MELLFHQVTDSIYTMDDSLTEKIFEIFVIDFNDVKCVAL